MTKTCQDISVFAGDSALVVIALTGDDGAPLDVASVDEIEWRLATTRHSEPLVSKTIGFGLTLIEGGIQLTLSAADTALLPGTYYHQMVTYDGETVATAMVGACVIRPSMVMTGRRIPAQMLMIGDSSLTAATV